MAHLNTRLMSVPEGALIALLGACALRPACAAEEFEVRTLSSRPDTVSGGDVLVQVIAPNRSHWIAQLDGRDVTKLFQPSERTGKLLGLLKGLKLGENRLAIVDGRSRSTLDIDNYPMAGPIFSGPHQEPFICQTLENGLGPALDSDCSAKTVVQYYYKSTEPIQASEADPMGFHWKPGSFAPGFKAYHPDQPPSDVAQTVTSDGQTVNYIVRREIGVINRAVYEIQFLHQPGQPLPTPWTRPTLGWNGRLVYALGGGCGSGYRQGTLWGAIGSNSLLEDGYSVATATLNIFQNNCNDRISAETLSMVKEYFIKQFGVPIHTIGEGGSGGAIQVQLIAQNYPGLLDGIIAKNSFADEASHSSDAGPTFDCSLLDHVFKTSSQHWTPAQKAAVSGFATWHTCSSGWAAFNLPILDPRNCDPLIPKEKIYDRVTHPKGVRCDIYDNEINFFGRDPVTGFARRTLDNVGVQYGLNAFNGGKIDVAQFIELNERIGGYDADGKIIPTRSAADSATLRIAYQGGLVLTGGGGLSQVPIIDSRWYTDDMADVHDRFRSFVTRARLIAANGNAHNQIILVGPRPEFLAFVLPDSANAQHAELMQRQRDLVRQMDRWLDQIAADRAPGALSAYWPSMAGNG